MTWLLAGWGEHGDGYIVLQCYIATLHLVEGNNFGDGYIVLQPPGGWWFIYYSSSPPRLHYVYTL